MNPDAGNHRVPLWGALCVAAASVLWGTTGTAATFAPAVSPLAVGAVAMGVGGLLQALYAVNAITGQWPGLLDRWRLVSLGAVAVAVYPLAFYSSMRLSGVAVGTVVSIGSAPVAAALIERFADGKPLSRRWAAGAFLGVMGAALLSSAGQGHEQAATSGSPGETWTPLAGIALGLVAGATYALYSWAAHRIIGGGISSRAAMGTVFGLGGLLLMPVLLATGAPLLESWTNFSVGAYMALVPMFAGYVLFGWGLARVRASTATGISLLETVVAAVLAVLVVGERLPLHGWLGAAVVIFSLFILTPGKSAGVLPAPPAPAVDMRDGQDTRSGQSTPAGQYTPPYQESSARSPLPPS
ncbi:EamA/RhaT family transporter [Arthrobacter sp. BB-1]|uniref:DMT family transporter n=1 Tax=unclassified Arthrobacter TaxID=235627 RepID=UPI0010DBE0FB|nr:MULTISPECIES: DMT family transporter [unclassified Arthrobacter]TNB76366.1 EamA/RhaT family transporter [Arthrobacter sp. BB-1]VII97668.1 Permease of the drug/metabolite transporter (DMT) superfamily [Arthrobacter sp. DR-2P]